MAHWQDPDAIAMMLDDCDVWAVVGLSGNPDRTAYRTAALLRQRIGARGVWFRLGGRPRR